MSRVTIASCTAALLVAGAAYAAELEDAAFIKEGERTFNVHCAVCHGPTGGGGAGPNLTDQYTLHGETYDEMLAVITSGVLDVGMPNWGERLSEERQRQVAAYVFSLFATKPRDKPPGANANLTLM
ncbi:MAG: c-type cytochrome [Alphaproteobacteria bacterium]|nr:c-type cytochrome [Alphaproteobacteria bacterium]